MDFYSIFTGGSPWTKAIFMDKIFVIGVGASRGHDYVIREGGWWGPVVPPRAYRARAFPSPKPIRTSQPGCGVTSSVPVDGTLRNENPCHGQTKKILRSTLTGSDCRLPLRWHGGAGPKQMLLGKMLR